MIFNGLGSTMKRLFLLRHAKSDWLAGSGSDHERPLNRRGLAAASTIGRFLSAVEQVPDLVLSSSATRARRTVEVAAEKGAWHCPIRIVESFYEASIKTVLAEVQKTEAPCQALLLAGHEPTWSELAGRLIGQAEVRMVTAALARIDFDVDDWREVDLGGGILMWLVTPKLLQQDGTPVLSP